MRGLAMIAALALVVAPVGASADVDADAGRAAAKAWLACNEAMPGETGLELVVSLNICGLMRDYAELSYKRGYLDGRDAAICEDALDFDAPEQEYPAP